MIGKYFVVKNVFLILLIAQEKSRERFSYVATCETKWHSWFAVYSKYFFLYSCQLNFCGYGMITSAFGSSPGNYEHLPLDNLPPIWLAYLGDPSDSGKIHSSVGARWRQGELLINTASLEENDRPLR